MSSHVPPRTRALGTPRSSSLQPAGAAVLVVLTTDLPAGLSADLSYAHAMPWALPDWTEWSTLFISAPVRWAKCVLLTSHSSFYYQRGSCLKGLILGQNAQKTTVNFLLYPLISASPSPCQTRPQKSQGPTRLYFVLGFPAQAVPRFWNHQKRKRNFCTSKHHSRFCPCPPSPPFCSLNFFAQTIIILNSLSFSTLICRIYMIVKVPIHLKSTLKYP